MEIQNKSTKKVIKDIVNDKTKHYIGKGTFAIAFRLRHFYQTSISNYLLDPTYFEVAISNSLYKRENETFIPEFNLLNYSRCDDSFPYVEEDLYNRVGLRDYLWINTTDYYLMSNVNGDEYRNLEINFRKWTNTSENNNQCQNEDTINDLFDVSYIEVSILSGYFDFDDYQSPIKTYISEFITLYLARDSSQELTMGVQGNKALISDSLFFGTQFVTEKFYSSIITSKAIYRNNEGILPSAYIIINQSIQSDQYERTVYSFLDLFGFLGGLFDFMLFIGYVLVDYFQSKSYHHKMLSNLYQVDHNENKDIPINNNSMNIEMSKSFSNLNRSVRSDLNINNSTISNSSITAINTMDKNKIKEITWDIQQRKALDFKWYHYVPKCYYCLWCSKLKSNKLEFKDYENIYK